MTKSPELDRASVLGLMLGLGTGERLRTLGIADGPGLAVYIYGYRELVVDCGLPDDFAAFRLWLSSEDEGFRKAGIEGYVGESRGGVLTACRRLSADVRRYLGQFKGAPPSEAKEPRPGCGSALVVLLRLRELPLPAFAGQSRLDLLQLFIRGYQEAQRDVGLEDDYSSFERWLGQRSEGVRRRGLVGPLASADHDVAQAVARLVALVDVYVREVGWSPGGGTPWGSAR